MNTYLILRHLHITCVALSGLGFALRGLLMLRQSPALRHPVARIAPHIIDTGLLASALGLLASALGMLALTTWQLALMPWLATKIVLLLVYIVLGTIALKRGRTLRIRAIAYVAALAVFGHIVATALTRNPLGLLSLL